MHQSGYCPRNEQLVFPTACRMSSPTPPSPRSASFKCWTRKDCGGKEVLEARLRVIVTAVNVPRFWEARHLKHHGELCPFSRLHPSPGHKTTSASVYRRAPRFRAYTLSLVSPACFRVISGTCKGEEILAAPGQAAKTGLFPLRERVFFTYSSFNADIFVAWHPEASRVGMSGHSLTGMQQKVRARMSPPAAESVLVNCTSRPHRQSG